MDKPSLVRAFNGLVALAAVATAACGASYPRGAVVRGDAKTAVYYPLPELPNDAATLTSLQASAAALGCTAAVINDQLAANCADAGGDIVFGANSQNASVLQIGCLTGVTDAKCEAIVKRIVAGRK